jgi:hypothetical protein
MKLNSSKLPNYLYRAVLSNIPLSRNEIIYQTIYNNNKCITLANLWHKLPDKDILFMGEINSPYELKTKILKPLEKKGQIIRGRAPERPEFKKSGYVVDVKRAYREKFPYTMANLDPFPVWLRRDYVFHLLIYKGANITYKAFPEKLHPELDALTNHLLYLSNEYPQIKELVDRGINDRVSPKWDEEHKEIEWITKQIQGDIEPYPSLDAKDNLKLIMKSGANLGDQYKRGIKFLKEKIAEKKGVLLSIPKFKN